MRNPCAILLVFLMLLTGCAAAQEQEQTLTVTFFQAGSADAILLQTGGQALLVDTGLNKNGDELVDSLRELGVERLSGLVITHFDKDHVGGADIVLESIPVDAAYQPDYRKDSKQMNQYLEAMEQVGLTPTVISQNQTILLGDARLDIDVANRADYGEDEENDFSLVISLTFGEVRFLLAGDAEEARIAELLQEGNLSHDVLKVPHHGKQHDNNLPFFRAVGAKYAVITSSEDEPEKEETVRQLLQCGTEVFLTRTGRVTMRCDGQSVTVLNQDM